MARHDPATELRVSSHARAHADEAKRTPDEHPRFRLVVTRGRLGVELDGGYTLGPLAIEQLSATFSGVRFPVELSGGVDAFRHKRGDLEHVRLGLEAAAIARLPAARLRGILGEATPNFICAALEEGFVVGVSRDATALAFEVLVAPLDGDVRFIPTAARGIGLDGPPQVYAVRVLKALLAPFGRVVGGAIVVEDLAATVARHVFPRAGMRAPSSRSMQWSSPQLQLTRLSLEAERDGEAAASSERVLSAVELASLVASAEQAMLASDMDTARREYLAALEQAPRHPEISRRLAELDRCAGGRVEAALGSLSDAMRPLEAGILGGLLLAEVGDGDGARVALRRAAESEPYGALASAVWLQLAQLASTPDEAEQALDEAVARAPASDAARWQRFEHRLQHGKIDGAREDVEHLEAAARGPQERHAVLRRAADRFLASRHLEQAAKVFERALRYAPDSVDGVAGLARALQTLGKRTRALGLLSRAVGLAERADRAAHRVMVDLARALVDVADDRPAAIAHVRRVPPWVAETFEARLLEGRWRAELGDLPGASVAIGQLGDAVEHALGLLTDGPESKKTPFAALWGPEHVTATRADAQRSIAQLLEEGARIEELDRADLRAARRLLSLALRLDPASRVLGKAFARVHAEVSAPREKPTASEAAIAPASEAAIAPASEAAIAPASEAAAVESRSGEALLPVVEPRAGKQPLESATMESAGSSLGRAIERLESEGLLEPQLDDDPLGLASVDDDPLGLASVDDDPFGLASVDDDPFGLASVDDETVQDEVLVEKLSEKVRADPNDMHTVRQLAAALERLERDMELVALLSARIEEGDESVRAELVPLHREALGRLADRAAEQGREGEAELYRSMLDQDPEES
jgi:tetratricopeptide (TPR) repeat protein